MKLNEDRLKDIFVNPYYAINFDESLFGEHEPMVDKKKWIQANTKLINEIGVEEWLEHLLTVIETGGVSSGTST